MPPDRPAPPPVIGFDLDMTLIDPRRSVRGALDALAGETGVDVDADEILATLGPPLEVALSPWFGPDDLAAACARFRAIHATLLHLTEAMPGAATAVRTVHGRGGRVVVVTAKFEPHARTSLQVVGMAADVVVGQRFGAAKGGALADNGALAYVGDHPADVDAARAAGIVAVGVSTGPASADELRAAGAEVVLRDLGGFGEWFEAWDDDRRAAGTRSPT
ncbi:MAG TPA: HAD hydrolase-like protein [Acidimicrobiales bacterium]|nr:HAD hydrolase-like protein [Acidimicrobiales bacterium]